MVSAADAGGQGSVRSVVVSFSISFSGVREYGRIREKRFEHGRGL